MQTCAYCGELIEFRYMGGAVIPIHINGNWCSSLASAKSDPRALLYRSYKEYDSYLDPNARCPVCDCSQTDISFINVRLSRIATVSARVLQLKQR